MDDDVQTSWEYPVKNILWYMFLIGYSQDIWTPSSIFWCWVMDVRRNYAGRSNCGKYTRTRRSGYTSVPPQEFELGIFGMWDRSFLITPSHQICWLNTEQISDVFVFRMCTVPTSSCTPHILTFPVGFLNHTGECNASNFIETSWSVVVRLIYSYDWRPIWHPQSAICIVRHVELETWNSTNIIHFYILVISEDETV
jgi:hypothetical protein